MTDPRVVLVPSFDRYVMVDWSAAGSPVRGADSIWIADLADGDDADVSNPSTRAAARHQLLQLIERSAAERVLIGIDASLGYPAGTATLFGLRGTPWEAMWHEITQLSDDDDRNRNNRFAVAAELNRRVTAGPGPFWGCPPARAGVDLRSTKPQVFAVGEFRRTEHCLRGRGLRPASAWQLFGAGSVGSQTLTAVPVLSVLRSHFPGRIEVWPFTTGLDAPQTRPGVVVVAEVWPTMFQAEADRDADAEQVKDVVQVRRTALGLRAADRSGELVRWLAPRLAGAGEIEHVVGEEGWILGVPDDAHLR